MDISASQYNSASESGWTHYLDQSSSLVSESYFQRIDEFEGKGAGRIMEEEEFEEDLSMVSDASSGPPHYDDASSWYCENNWYANNNNNTKESQKKKKKKMMVKEFGRSQQQQQQSSYLDDTASSPIFNFPKESHKKSFSGNGAVEDALDFSQCLSVTRIKRKPKFQNLFRGKQASEEQGGFDEEGRK